MTERTPGTDTAAMLRQLADLVESGQIETVTIKHAMQSSSLGWEAGRINQLVSTVTARHRPDQALWGTDGIAHYNSNPARTADEMIAQWGFVPQQVVQNADRSDVYMVVDVVREAWHQGHWTAQHQAGIEMAP